MAFASLAGELKIGKCKGLMNSRGRGSAARKEREL